MSFYVFISRNVFFDSNDNIREEMFTLARLVKTYPFSDIKLCIVTRYQSINKYKLIVDEKFDDIDIKFLSRGKAQSKFKESVDFNVMLIGYVDYDIRIAANNKILLINPGWLSNVEENIHKYGFKLNDIEQVLQCIEILKLETEVYYNVKIDEHCDLLAISDAKTYYAVNDEKEIKEIYKRTLKKNNETYRYAVYFHYLTMIYGMGIFHDIDYWMAIPSSTGENKNYVYDIVKRTRYLLNNRKSKDLLIRHTCAKKSAYMSPEEKSAGGAKRHLDTIHLNPEYRGKLKGKKVVVLDDYTTTGYSFESARNLLMAEGVKKIIFVAIGTFQSVHKKEDFVLGGDVFSPYFNVTKISAENINGYKNSRATQVLSNIYSIISK